MFRCFFLVLLKGAAMLLKCNYMVIELIERSKNYNSNQCRISVA